MWPDSDVTDRLRMHLQNCTYALRIALKWKFSTAEVQYALASPPLPTCYGDCVVSVEMASFLSCLVSLSIVVCVVCLPTAQNLTLIEVVNNNTSLARINIDPRFRIRAEVLDYTMESHSVYMNAIAYMSTTSQGDFNGILRSADIISMPPWNDVAISVVPNADHLQRRHVLWGVYKGLDFARASGWRAANFFLLWDNIVVGRLQFTSVAPSNDKAGYITATCDNQTAPESSSISPEWKGKVNCIKNPYSSELDPASNTARIILSPSYLSNARSLSADRIYNTMAGIITHVAEEGSGNRLENLQWTEEDYETSIDLTNVGPEGSSPRTFTNGMSTRAMWKLALWIEGQNRYDECKTQVKFSGRTVGRVEIKASTPVILS